jgi:hypothetical protein
MTVGSSVRKDGQFRIFFSFDIVQRSLFFPDGRSAGYFVREFLRAFKVGDSGIAGAILLSEVS